MSQPKEVDTNSDEKISTDTTSPNFLFIDIGENIKKEIFEDEQLKEEDVEKRIGSDDIPQEDFMPVVTEGDSEKSPPRSSDHQQSIDDKGDSPSDGFENTDPSLKNNNQAFSCDKCSISFVSPVYLEGHKNRCRARLDENLRSVETADTQTLSDSCDDTNTPITKKIKSRIPRGELKHKCKTCERGFVRLSYLKAHEATHTTAFKCDVCPYTTDLRRNLNRHMIVHYGKEDKIYACPHCSYTAGKSSYLRRHVAKHSQEKMHKCHICSYETAISCNLTIHMTTHNGQKQFACSHCYYSTARKVQLAKHLEKFHSTQ